MLKKILIGTISLVIALSIGACSVPASDETVVTFEFHTYDAQQVEVRLPVDITYLLPGYAPWTPGEPELAPYTSGVSSKQYESAAYDIEAVVRVVGPPGTVITCAWVASTPAGTRSSERSQGGGGDGVVPEGGTEAITRCHYLA